MSDTPKSFFDMANEEMTALIKRIAEFETMGVIEVAIRNPNVNSFVDEKERRINKLEAENVKLLEHLSHFKELAMEKEEAYNRANNERYYLRKQLEEIEAIADDLVSLTSDLIWVDLKPLRERHNDYLNNIKKEGGR